MTRATIPHKRKHIYFYILLVLVPLVIGAYWPSDSHMPAAKTRASEVNKLADILFQ